MTTVLPLALAALGAFLNAGGDLLQRRVTRDEPDDATGGARLLLDLARRPAWLAGVVAGLLGLAVHVVALSIGEIATVQPLLALELPVSVIGMSWLFGVRLSRRDWLAVAMLTVGLAAFVAFLAPSGGDPSAVSGGTWAVGLGVLAALVAAAVVGAVLSGADLRAGLLGVAAGTGYGTTAVLFSAAGAAAAAGVGAVLGSWQAYTAVAVGLLSFYLLQNSLNSGLLVATEPGLTLANPVVAVLWGLLVFGERPRTGPWLIGTALGALLLVAGTLLLCRSPVLEGGGDGSHGSGAASDGDRSSTRAFQDVD